MYEKHEYSKLLYDSLRMNSEYTYNPFPFGCYIFSAYLPVCLSQEQPQASSYGFAVMIAGTLTEGMARWRAICYHTR